jgi:hypothetical protein
LFPVEFFIFLLLFFVRRRLRAFLGLAIVCLGSGFVDLGSRSKPYVSGRICVPTFWFSRSLPREELEVRLDFCSNFCCCACHGPCFPFGVSATVGLISRVKSSICARLSVRAPTRESKRAPLGFIREGGAPAYARLGAVRWSKWPVSFQSCARAQ